MDYVNVHDAAGGGEVEEVWRVALKRKTVLDIDVAELGGSLVISRRGDIFAGARVVGFDRMALLNSEPMNDAGLRIPKGNAGGRIDFVSFGRCRNGNHQACQDRQRSR
jgi:hypothetical protein